MTKADQVLAQETSEMIAGLRENNARLRKIIARLSKDAARYRWLYDRLSHQQSGPHTGWGTDELIPGDDPDSAIDAAMMRELEEGRE